MMKITLLIRYMMILLTLTALMGTSGCMQGCQRGLRDSETALIGIITNVEDQIPVSRVQVEIKNTSTGQTYRGTTDQQGRYRIMCESGYYQIRATHPNYLDYSRNIVLGRGTNQEDFYMSPKVETPAIFEGVVKSDETKKPMENVTIQVGNHLAKTDARGRFRLADLPMGTYPVWITARGYEAINESVTLLRGKNNREYTLERLDLSTAGVPAQPREMNPVIAIDPTMLGDFRAHTVRVLQPMNERHEYALISESRHRRHLQYDEHVDAGEVIFADGQIYIKFLDQWQVPEEIHTSSRPDAFITEDIALIIYYFNFPDDEIVITEVGSEVMNGYNTRKFHLSHKPGAPPEKQLDLHLWVISDEGNPRLHRMITRFEGRLPVMQNLDTWSEIDTNFTHINEGNNVELPDIHEEERR